MDALVIAVVAFGVGFYSVAQIASRVEGFAANAVAALVGSALAVAALGVYEMIRALDRVGSFSELSGAKSDIVARTIIETLAGAGALAGLAAAIYLLAPRGD